MSNLDVQYAVLDVLLATERALTADEIRDRTNPTLDLRSVRIALRDLREAGEVLKDTSDRFSAIIPTAAEDHQSTGGFTEAELQRARKRHGATTKCPRCGKDGDIDSFFGWRRMRREDEDIRPQSQCYECRKESWQKAP